MPHQRSRTTRALAPRPRRRAHTPAAADLGFRDVFENANDIVMLSDRAGRVVEANRAAREFGGYTREEVERGVDLRGLLTPQEYEAAMLLTQLALDGLPFPEMYERVAILRDGSRRMLELRSSVLQRPGQDSGLLQTIGRDVTESRQAAAFQASLVQVSQALLSAQSVDEVGAVMCEAARQVLEVDGVYLWIRRGEQLIACASAGPSAAQFVGLLQPLSDALLRRINQASDMLVLNDLEHAHDDLACARTLGVQALLAIPLRRSGDPVGMLIFTDGQQPQSFAGTRSDRALIFAGQAAVAIESALAREREEEEGRVSAALLHVTRAIRESLEEAEVLAQIASSARDVLQCDWTFVTLWNEDRDALRIVTAEGWPADVVEELRLLEFRADAFPDLHRLLARETIAVEQPEGDNAGMYQRYDVSCNLGAPMVRAGKLIGSIHMGYRVRRGPFSTRECRIMEGIAAQAAVAVDNARLVEDLRRANELKSEFLGTMSHELRTPLSAFLGYTELLREGVMGPVDAQQRQVLDRMLVNGRSLLDLITSTLDVNRLEAGRIAVAPSIFVLHELLSELRDHFAARLIGQAIPIIWPEAGGSPSVRTDRGKLKVIVRNLVDNALKFTHSGSVTVAVETTHSSERVCVSVTDTGVGIPLESRSTIFEMFRQLPNAVPESRAGVGLGLYLVRRYAQLLGGDVTVESTPGRGSTFRVHLPAQL